MKTAEEILEKYVETPFRHTKIVDKNNCLKAMEEYVNQFKTKQVSHSTSINLLSDIEEFLEIIICSEYTPISHRKRAKELKEKAIFNDKINTNSYSKESFLEKNNDVDIVGNCANCGVEYHIHKLEPSNEKKLVTALEQIATGEIPDEPKNYKDTLQICRDIAKETLKEINHY